MMMRTRLAAAIVALHARAAAGVERPARADDPVKGEVKVFTENGYVRLVFRLDEAVPATVQSIFRSSW